MPDSRQEIEISETMKLKTILTLTFLLLFSALEAQELPIKNLDAKVDVSTDVLQAYVGFYKIEAMSLVIEVTAEQDKLYVEVAGMGKILLQAGSHTAFAAKALEAQIEFMDIGKQAQSIKLYQGGSVLEGQRTAAPKEHDYQAIALGSDQLDYQMNFTPFESEWDLIINDRKVGTAKVDLRHGIYEGIPSYEGGSIIRYESMGNKPFADRSHFAKNDFAPLQSRNAISQKEEITTHYRFNTANQYTIDIDNGEIKSTNQIKFDSQVFSTGIYKILAMDLKEGLAVKFPIPGINGLAWEKALVVKKEKLQIPGLEGEFDTWRIEYSSGTIKWVSEKAPYLIQWQMPTGMTWKLKHFQ